MIKEVFFDLLQQYRLDFNFRLSYVLFILFHFANFELALTEMEAIKNEIALSFAEKFVLYLLKSTANERIIQRCESANEKWSIFAINDVINYVSQKTYALNLVIKSFNTVKHQRV